MNLTLLSPGSRIVVSYPGEPSRFFERIRCWLVGPLVMGRVGRALAVISKFILKDMGNAAGLSDVTGQSEHPRSVVHLEQIMDAPSDEDVRSLVESARDEALMERRRRNLVVDREPSFCHFLDW